MEENRVGVNNTDTLSLSDVRNNSEFRDKKIIQTSIVGIVANVFLAVFKAVIGLMTNSIAIVLDAVNNASDVASSVVTIIGAKLSKKEPDKAHPFGHGRVEYLSAMVIAAILLYAGVPSAVTSIKRIISPDAPEYFTVSLIIVAVVSLLLRQNGIYYIKTQVFFRSQE